MELNQRQKQILATLKSNQDVQIDHLADQFAVTTQTIRRDVNQLCEQGLARRVHGGVSLPTALTNTSYRFRTGVESEVKDGIAMAVANAIPEGSTVMMGIGTTVTRIAQYLLAKPALRVITNNLQVARILEANEQIEVYLAGGLLRREHQDMVGSSVVSFFSDFEADIGICGCGSITTSHYAMEHEQVEADLSKAILNNSRECWLVADASKWGRFAALKVAPLDRFDRIYTNNRQLPEELNVQLIDDTVSA
ncbi:DeoR/GlpR family DNA-binding transcription regulator [Vibrio sp. D404a]|uniref:DeoR/GlpR family DNA-binding transcription regulator n=1 Tax=unclassified Vibrio TaxID=2614977 RepID=UPI0025550DA4|nr:MULTISPECIES: DeoR/GlpR family DNA-binding transcription regulator [unclassified Vibrio]MDK9736517.1 DeoR/GlpR family DNA-binding transcription regulator [Vibrio sp. D404a]MDK9796826.1 DeoR/GlpR family DNA-binding transcription regulator [Vibrio sp. D449a]|tara:strand:+ start:1318 stop:2070 length:753 start_codon:yes stop_codon:yes gene_type:complete